MPNEKLKSSLTRRHSVRPVEQAPGDHLRLDFRGALENVEDAGVAENPRHREFERKAVAAVDLHGIVGRGPGDARGGSGRSDQGKRDEACALLAPSRSTPRASSSSLAGFEKWSKLHRQPFPVDTASSRGSVINGANMERFIRSQNVERFRRLLERVTEQSDRQKIMNLLADELQKQKNAGDPR